MDIFYSIAWRTSYVTNILHSPNKYSKLLLKNALHSTDRESDFNDRRTAPVVTNEGTSSTNWCC